MMRCNKCGTEFDGIFCPECGEKCVVQVVVNEKEEILKERESLENQRKSILAQKAQTDLKQKELEKQQKSILEQKSKLELQEKEILAAQGELTQKTVRSIVYPSIQEAELARQENDKIENLKNRLLTTKSQKKRKKILGEFHESLQTQEARNRYERLSDKVNQEVPKKILICRILGFSIIISFFIMLFAESNTGLFFFSTAWGCVSFWVWVVWKIVLIVQAMSKKHYLNIKDI